MKIIIAIIIFSAIILFHELGHFLLAKKNKIVVTEFSLGMGPRLLEYREKWNQIFPETSAYRRFLCNAGEDTDEEDEPGTLTVLR